MVIFIYIGVVCTIEGTTITAGTSTLLQSAEQTIVSAVALTENKVFIAYGAGSSYTLRGIVCTIEGTTITAGTETQLNNYTRSANQISAVKLTENKVFISIGSGSTDSPRLRGLICTINGTEIIINVDTYIAGTYTGKYSSAVALTENKVFIAYGAGSSYTLRGIVCTIEGTTITAGTETQLNNQKYSGKYSSAVALTENKVFIAYEYIDNNSYYLYRINLYNRRNYYNSWYRN